MKDSPTSGGKPASTKRTKGGPIGTHSLTGDAANVGVPSSPGAHARSERSNASDLPPGARDNNPQADPGVDAVHPSGRAAERNEALANHVPTPDEDGPHDVPDEKVIEKTLPTVPISDSAGGGSEQMH